MSKLVIVIERLTTLFEKVYKTMVNWPKREITGFQYMVKEKFVNTISKIVTADEVKSKRDFTIKDVLSDLRTLHVLMDFSSRNGFISKPFFADVSIELNDIKETLITFIK